MYNDIMPNFIRQEGETWQTVFCYGVGKEEKNWIKCNRILLNYPQNLVHRAAQNVKNQVLIFVRNAIVWG
jgi:hypothetical protein